MLAALLCQVLLLGQVGLPGLPDTPAVERPPTTQATTRATSNADDRGLGESLKKTTLGDIFIGNRRISPEEAASLKFWIDTLKEPLWVLVGFIPRMFVALLFLIIFWLIYRGFRRMILGNMKKGDVDSSIRDMLAALLKWGIMGFGLVIACNQIGIQITALLTGVSLIGLAVGFAAQESLANFIAGIVIFWDKPFKVGDWIEVDGCFGQVQRVTFRSTRLLDLDGQLVIMPNTAMLSHRVSNHTSHPGTRIHVPVGIAYKESIEDARRVLLATVKDDQRILAGPPPSVVVMACGDSSVNLELRFWITDNSIEHAIKDHYQEQAKQALAAAGISIPFPHLQLFLEETPATQALAGGVAARKAG